ncbi:hypothetical protein M2318_003939 [Metapseudomonas resinovorans]|uniref:primase-helicase family protein n=1 Tax=Metapseudomonas resinovorans TaxID=53412 RepID=UPI003D239D11
MSRPSQTGAASLAPVPSNVTQLKPGAKSAPVPVQRHNPPVHPSSLATLHQISDDFVMLTGREPLAYRVATGARMGPAAFAQWCSGKYGPVVTVATDGALGSRDSGSYWWSLSGGEARKRVVENVVMEPTLKPDNLFGDVYNRWYVLKQEMCEPDPGATASDIQPLIDHLMYISDGDSIGVIYFLNWLAQLWQTPDIKIPTAIMFYSRHGGVGKSMLAKLIGYVFGESLVKSCAGSVLHKNFMDAVEHKRIMVLNELARADRLDNYETFKSLVSEGTMEFEGKHRASREVKNFLHWIITTNNADCLPLMQGDRRILVLRCEAERKDDAYYAGLADWIENEGPELLAGCFAKWQFPKDWDPYAPVPQTEATRLTQLESRDALVNFIEELFVDGKAPFDKDMGRVNGLIAQLSASYPNNMRGLRLNNRTLPEALLNLGFRKIQSGTAASNSFWCWRNGEQWEAAGLGAWRRHLETGERLPGMVLPGEEVTSHE